MQHEVFIELESAAILDADAVAVRRLTGTEALGQPFAFDVHLVTLGTEAVDVGDLLHAQVAIVFSRTREDRTVKEEMRRVYGMVRRLRNRCFADNASRELILEVVPRVWRGSLTTTNDIYMQMAVPDVLLRKVEDMGLDPDADAAVRLMGEYPEREFIVQYGETDLAFVQRLAEDAGITISFEHDDELQKEIIVFSDHNDAFTPAVEDTLELVSRGEHHGVYALEATTQWVTTHVRSRDYNYRNPAMDLLGEASLDVVGAGVLNEYGAHVKTPEEASAVAQVRAEEVGVEVFNLWGRSDVAPLRAGGKVTIEGHAYGDLGELLLLEVVHEADQSVFGMAAEKAHHAYRNDFRAIPAAIPFRPPRVTPRPVVHGVVTGIVQHSSDTAFGAVDDHGNYRVAFMYDAVSDREPGKASRSVRMAQPSAGPDRGLHLPLKPGTEVLMTCVNGDPDRPIIIGAVPNPQTYSPVNATNAEKSVLTTNVSMMEFDDRDARMKLTVGDSSDPDNPVKVGANVFQMGAPNAPEQGILMGTVSNITTMSNEVMTHITNDWASFSNGKTDFCSNNVVTVAGYPHPMGYWTKGEAVAADIVKWGKTTAKVLTGIKDTMVLPEKKQKDAAEKKLAAAKRVQRDDPSPANKQKVKAAQSKADAAARTLEKAEGALAPAMAGAVGADSASVFDEMGKAKDFASSVAKLLYSKIAKAGADAVTGLMRAGAAQAQDRMAQAVKDAAQRAEADLGSFAKAPGDDDDDGEGGDALPIGKTKGEAFSLDASSHTVASIGNVNAFIFGGDHATLGSDAQVTVASGEWAHVKGVTGVEVAGGDEVKVTATALVDVHCDGLLKIVADEDQDAMEVPTGFDMLLHAKSGIRAEATKDNLMLDAMDGSFIAHGKKMAAFGSGGSSGFGVLASSSTLCVAALSSIDTDQPSPADDCMIALEDGECRIAIGSSKATMKSSSYEVRGGDCKLEMKSNVTIDGQKIKLG